MAKILTPSKALSTNPLKSSAPLGAAMAYLGVDGGMPIFHGSQGCTAFALVLTVRHFREPIPLQTTAMDEVATILGGAENVEEAIVNLRERQKPRLIGFASTALTETRGEDMLGDIKTIRAKRPELADTAIVYASTPDFEGGFELGWSKALVAMIGTLVPESDPAPRQTAPRQINMIMGSHLTPGDVEALADLARAFGLTPVVFPDISGALDGHVEASWKAAASGGVTLEEIRSMGASQFTLAFGESTRPAAVALEKKTGVPFRLFQSASGLKPCDAIVRTLMGVAGVDDAPARVKRARSRLIDASLDAHFNLGGLKLAIGADPDLLFALSTALAGMGAEIVAAVTTSSASPILERTPTDEVLVGDLADLERLAREHEADMLLTHAHGRQAAGRLGVPLYRVGFPIFDRLGAQHVVSVGYDGTRALIQGVANTIMAEAHAPKPEDFAPQHPSTEAAHEYATVKTH
jgi:nitrogenase molybdenum-iron protein NifN